MATYAAVSVWFDDAAWLAQHCAGYTSIPPLSTKYPFRYLLSTHCTFACVLIIFLCFLSQRDNVPGSEYTTGGAAGAGTELPSSTTTQTKRMAADTPRHHNPHDSWSSKDLLLAFVPVMIAYAFRVRLMDDRNHQSEPVGGRVEGSHLVYDDLQTANVRGDGQLVLAH